MNDKSNPIVIWYNELTKNDSYLLFLFLANLIIRIFHHLIYSEVTYVDTESYLELTNCLLTMDFSNYQAVRTPVYPFVLFLHHIDDRLVWVAQSLMGISNSILLYLIAKNITKNKIAFIIAITYSLSFNILFTEAALLSETTSIFFLLLTIFTFTKFIKENKKIILIIIGIFSTLAILTRPIMIVSIPALLIALLFINGKNNKRTQLIHILYYLTPVLVLIIGLCLFNYTQVNYFGINTNSGLGLCNISGAFVEKSTDPEYQQIREILIEFRTKRGTHNWVAHHALEEMLEKTGLTFSELSKKLTAMSFQLFLNNPDLYFKSIVPSYINYWRVGILWVPENISPRFIKNIIEVIWAPQKIILGIINVIFIISLILIIFRKKSLIITRNPIILLMILLVIFSSILQALVESL